MTNNVSDASSEVKKLHLRIVSAEKKIFSDDVLEGKLQKVAAELSDKEIRNQRFLNKAFIMTGIKKGIIHESAWIEGSIVRNQKNIDSNLRHARLYKYFVYMKKWLKQATGR